MKFHEEIEELQRRVTVLEEAAAGTDAPAPSEVTPEDVVAQNEHDLATGNVNDKGETSYEAVATEQDASLPAAKATRKKAGK